MSRQWLFLAAVCASGCSLLFDPSRVDSGVPACPESSASCPARDHAEVECLQEQCVYACRAGFSDRDFDLNAATSNGCETDCSAAAAVANPAGVVATVGMGSSVLLQWPEPAPPADAYRVCTSTVPELCTNYPAPAVCDGGVCSAGFPVPDSQRLQSTVTALSLCRGPATAPPAPSASYASFNGGAPLAYQIDSTCGATITEVAPGVMQVSQNGLCSTTFQASDNQWRNGFVQVDINIAAVSSAPFLVGAAMHSEPSSGYAVAASTTLREAEYCTDLIARTSGNTLTHGATSAFCPQPGRWVTVRLTGEDGMFSLATANEGEPLAERIRWPSTAADAGNRAGRPGLFLATLSGTGTAQFRNFRVSTNSSLPPRGPTSAAYDFASGQLPAGWKASQSGARVPTVGNCPPWGSATGCANCAPAGGARCLAVSRQGFVGTPAMFDLPTGIDVTRPWSLSMRLGAADGGFNNAFLVSTTHGGILDVAGNSAAPLRTAGQPLGFPMELSAWHRATWQFIPDGGSGYVAVSWDGTPRAPLQLPGWDRHPGRIQLGGAGGYSFFAADYDLVVTDISVSQP